MTLFLLMFFVVIGVAIIMNKINKKEYLIENVVKTRYSSCIDFSNRKLFTAREKMYKNLGFSNKSSNGQADAIFGQFVAAVGGGMI